MSGFVEFFDGAELANASSSPYYRPVRVLGDVFPLEIVAGRMVTMFSLGERKSQSFYTS